MAIEKASPQSGQILREQQAGEPTQKIPIIERRFALFSATPSIENEAAVFRASVDGIFQWVKSTADQKKALLFSLAKEIDVIFAHYQRIFTLTTEDQANLLTFFQKLVSTNDKKLPEWLLPHRYALLHLGYDLLWVNPPAALALLTLPQMQTELPLRQTSSLTYFLLEKDDHNHQYSELLSVKLRYLGNYFTQQQQYTSNLPDQERLHRQELEQTINNLLELMKTIPANAALLHSILSLSIDLRTLWPLLRKQPAEIMGQASRVRKLFLNKLEEISAWLPDPATLQLLQVAYPSNYDIEQTFRQRNQLAAKIVVKKLRQKELRQKELRQKKFYPSRTYLFKIHAAIFASLSNYYLSQPTYDVTRIHTRDEKSSPQQIESTSPALQFWQQSMDDYYETIRSFADSDSELNQAMNYFFQLLRPFLPFSEEEKEQRFKEYLTAKHLPLSPSST